MSNLYNLDGRIALVCGGGGGGAGTATSLKLAQLGADIVAVDRTQELVDELAARVAETGRRFWGLAADLRDPEQVATILPFLKRNAGRLDVLANIAGGTQRGEWLSLEDTSDQVFRDVMALNFDYVFQVCRSAGKLMIEQESGGAIVNIASISSVAAAPFHGPYGAAKRAVVALTQTMAVEWGRYGIRANIVTPGAVRTARALQSGAGASMDERQQLWAPLQRPVEKEEIAETVAFLLSDASSAITGQNIAVDCGVSVRAVGGGIEYWERHRQPAPVIE